MNIEPLKPKIKELAEKYHLKLIILYGSHAQNKQRSNSDIDIAVMGEKNLSLNELININNEFAQIFKVNDIDVKSLHGTNPLFKYEVSSHGIPLYDENNLFIKFKVFNAREYIATQDLRDLEKLIIHKRQKLLKKELYD